MKNHEFPVLQFKKQRMHQAKYHLIICCMTRFQSGQTKEKGCSTLRFSRQFFINLFSIHFVEWQPLLSTLNDEQWNRWTERILNDLVLKVNEMRVADKVIYQGKASQCMYAWQCMKHPNNGSRINIYRLCASVISKLCTMNELDTDFQWKLYNLSHNFKITHHHRHYFVAFNHLLIDMKCNTATQNGIVRP